MIHYPEIIVTSRMPVTRIGQIINRLLGSLGFEIRSKKEFAPPVELSQVELELVRDIQKKRLSLASSQRLFATLMACKHVLDRDVPGDFVECGVWRGGNALLAARYFDLRGSDRRVFLFDTFTGMTAPTTSDFDLSDGSSAEQRYRALEEQGWCRAPLERVTKEFHKHGVFERARFIQGDVQETLLEPENLPRKIAVLRLDTDWYESTITELRVLYPLLSIGGVLLVDDYGHWAGAKQAVDEFFEREAPRPFLQVTDYTGRAAIKHE